MSKVVFCQQCGSWIDRYHPFCSDECQDAAEVQEALVRRVTCDECGVLHPADVSVRMMIGRYDAGQLCPACFAK